MSRSPLSYSDPACIELMTGIIDGSARGSRYEARNGTRLLTHHEMQLHILPTPERKKSCHTPEFEKRKKKTCRRKKKSTVTADAADWPSVIGVRAMRRKDASRRIFACSSPARAADSRLAPQLFPLFFLPRLWRLLEKNPYLFSARHPQTACSLTLHNSLRTLS